MADLRTTVTELITGLGMLGHDDVDTALRARPHQMVSVSPEQWSLLQAAFGGGALSREFDAAFANGQAFLRAKDGLRGRIPEVIEWKGAQSNPGDEVLPVDIRIDHVFLVSCKYLSKIVHNAAPARVFEHSLRPAQASRTCDWFQEVAPEEHQELYVQTVQSCAVTERMPAKVTELSRAERLELKALYPKKWPLEVDSSYMRLCKAVSEASAFRWQKELTTKAEQELTLWRVLRFGPAPYFVLGASVSDPLRLRIATPWDWRQQFALQKFAVEPKLGGQPMVTWRAMVKNKHSGTTIEVNGHVEIRWSHRRFVNPPEAKVYLDTPHHLIPGYFTIE